VVHPHMAINVRPPDLVDYNMTPAQKIFGQSTSVWRWL